MLEKGQQGGTIIRQNGQRHWATSKGIVSSDLPTQSRGRDTKHGVTAPAPTTGATARCRDKHPPTGSKSRRTHYCVPSERYSAGPHPAHETQRTVHHTHEHRFPHRDVLTVRTSRVSWADNHLEPSSQPHHGSFEDKNEREGGGGCGVDRVLNQRSTRPRAARDHASGDAGSTVAAAPE